jgi:homospermidine synthase
MASNKPEIYGRIDGPVVLIGFGAIGRGSLSLLLRHFACDRSKVTVIDPDDRSRGLAEQEGVRFEKAGVTRENHRSLLLPLLGAGPGQGFLINFSVGVSSFELIELCRQANALYLDTVIEPPPGTGTDRSLDPARRTNYAKREQLLEQRRAHPSRPTAVSCCGANPGMVSWFVKQALLDVAAGVGLDPGEPKTREEWGRLMRRAGVKGIHVAERDTQRAKTPKPMGEFVNTWSVEGLVTEALQPAELGWGTHEKALPPEGRRHEAGCGAAIYLLRPGGDTRVRSWCPTPGPQRGFLVTHNESISIADYFTVREKGEVVYRPTCHYAYHPANDAVLSLHELIGSGGEPPTKKRILGESEILDGFDELGVLLYGHAKNAYWYGSRLTIEETRRLAPGQNATGLQVTSAAVAGMAWALENPKAGIVEADDLDFRRCLEIQRPYLGSVFGVYTDWTPLVKRGELFPEELDESDPWQFKNVIVR